MNTTNTKLRLRVSAAMYQNGQPVKHCFRVHPIGQSYSIGTHWEMVAKALSNADWCKRCPTLATAIRESVTVPTFASVEG